MADEPDALGKADPADLAGPASLSPVAAAPRREAPQSHPLPVPAKDERQILLDRITARADEVEALLREKEQLVLGYVFRGTPKPYYKRWKEEANDVFAALVLIKCRRLNAARRVR